MEITKLIGTLPSAVKYATPSMELDFVDRSIDACRDANGAKYDAETLDAPAEMVSSRKGRSRLRVHHSP